MKTAIRNNATFPSPFTGKERDRETGFSYFGARYYDSDLSGLFLSVDPIDLSGLFLSVDPMADKYPNISPYAYCAWNPVRLVDPDGDTIINAYEQYKDISTNVAYYQHLIQNSKDADVIKAYNDQIDYVIEENKKYMTVASLLDSFVKTNKDEYDLIDNISFAGSPINIYVGLKDDRYDSGTGAVGTTTFRYFLGEENEVIGILNNQFKIDIYLDGFNDEHKGLGTLSNEFGDVLFAISRPDYNNNTNNMGLPYLKIPTTKFSFDYEKYIVSKGSIPRPDPMDY